MAEGPPASHNENCDHSWLQNTVEAHQLLLDMIVCFAMSDFGRTHVAFRLMITCAVRRYGFLLRTLLIYNCRRYLAAAYIAVCTSIFRIFGGSQDVQTLDKLNCANRQLYLPAEFGGLNVPPLELDAAHAHYASFTKTLANLIIDYESKLLGPMYGLIRQELMNVAASTLPSAVQLRSSYDTSSTMGGFSESVINTLNQNLSDYAGPDVELVVSLANNVGAPTTHLTCLQLITPDTLTRSGDSGGHIQRGISRILRARAYLNLLAFCKPSQPDYMRVISGTGRGALAFFFASHESSFKVPSDFYMMAAYRVLGLTAERASHGRKCPRCSKAPSSSRGFGSSSTVSGTSISGERSTAPMLTDHIPRCPCSLYVIQLHDRIIHVLEEFMRDAGTGLPRDGTCGWRSAIFGRERIEIVMGTWFGWTSWLRTVILLLM
jgi:hypothetical protein